MNPARLQELLALQEQLTAYNARPKLGAPVSEDLYQEQALLVQEECQRWARRYAEAILGHDESVVDPISHHVNALRGKYGEDECARVLAWHAFGGSTREIDGPHRYDHLDFPGEDSFTELNGLFAQNQVQVYVGFHSVHESGIQAST